MKEQKTEIDMIAIDLNGPQGNAFYILGVAKKLGDKLGKDTESILKRMQSGDYKNLIDVFEEEFGEFVVMYE